MADWNELFPEGTTVDMPQRPPVASVDLTQGQAPTVGGAGFSLMQAHPMPEIEAAHIPASTPQDLEKRKAGWMELINRFQTNPNLQRAVMLAGAHMMQPLQPGQNAGGALAQSTVVGMNAYQQGQAADLAQKQGLRKEGREDMRLSIEQQRLEEAKKTGATGRAATEASTAGVRLQNTVLGRTLDDVIASAKTKREAAELGLDEAKRDAAVKDLERDNAALKMFAERPEIADRVKQEIALNEAKLQALRVGTRKGAAEATTAEQDAALGAEGRAKLKHGATTTAFGAQWSLLKEAHEKSPELQRLHPDVNAWLANLTTGAKTNPATMFKAISETLDAMPRAREGETPNPLRKRLEAAREQLLGQMTGGGAATPPAPGAADPGGTAAGLITQPPAPGYVENGWRFKGGDPSKQTNWEKVQ